MIFDVDDVYEIEEDYEIKLEKKDKEIERLNNIINELEKWIEYKNFNEGTYCIDCIQVKNKINQLKTGGRQ